MDKLAAMQTFVRIVDKNTIELHYKPHGDPITEHYSMLERKAGRWESTLAGLRDVHVPP